MRHALIGLLAYTLLALAYTFPLIFHLNSGFLHGIDSTDAYQLTWVLGWVQHAIFAHVNPYNAPIYFPTTTDSLGYIDSLFPLALLTLPVDMATHNSLVVYNIALIVSFPLSAISMFALARYHTQDSRAAFLAGMVFAFAPYRARHLEHLNMLNAECIPLTLLFFELARSRGGYIAWFGLGASLVLGAVTSLYYLAFVLVALGVYVAVLCLRRVPVFSANSFRGAVAGLATLPVLATSLLPYLAIQSRSSGPRRLQDMVFFSADVRDYLHSAPQSLLYGWTDAILRLGLLDGRQFLFPGFVATGLAFVACMRRRASRTDRHDADSTSVSRAHVTVALVLSVFTLGPYLRLFGLFTHIPLPYMALYFLVPPLRGLRDVGRYEQVALAFLGVALAFGATGIQSRAGPSVARCLFCVLVFSIAAECCVVQRPLVAVKSGSSVPAVYRWLDRQPSGVTVELPMCDARLPGSICTEEFVYMYYQTYHWQTLVNGWAGSYPLDWGKRVATLQSFPSAKAWAYLRLLRVRYIIVHPNFFGIASVRSWLGHQNRHRDTPVGTYTKVGGDLVLTLKTGL